MLEGFCFSVFFCFFKQTNTHAKKQQKITKENNTGTKHKWKHAECDHVKKKAEKSSEAESFKHMKIKYPTRPEDGHVDRNM
jgi:hypothetical protein